MDIRQKNKILVKCKKVLEEVLFDYFEKSSERKDDVQQIIDYIVSSLEQVLDKK